MSTYEDRIYDFYRAVLVRRGVPDKFIDDIASRNIPWFGWVWGLVGAWVIGTFLVLRLGGVRFADALSIVYSSQATKSDLLIPGNSFFTLEIILGICFHLLPLWIAIFVSCWPDNAEPNSKNSLDKAAKKLRSVAPNEHRATIKSDPALARLAYLPTTEAFLTTFARVDAAKIGPSKAIALKIVGGISVFVGVVMIGLYVITGCDYTRIFKNVVEYRFLNKNYNVPLSQIDSVWVNCKYVYQSARGTSSYWSKAYDIRFKGITINLFNAENPLHPFSHSQNLATILATDTYIQSALGPVRKLSPQAAAGCINDWPAEDPLGRSELSRILTD